MRSEEKISVTDQVGSVDVVEAPSSDAVQSKGLSDQQTLKPSQEPLVDVSQLDVPSNSLEEHKLNSKDFLLDPLVDSRSGIAVGNAQEEVIPSSRARVGTSYDKNAIFSKTAESGQEGSELSDANSKEQSFSQAQSSLTTSEVVASSKLSLESVSSSKLGLEESQSLPSNLQHSADSQEADTNSSNTEAAIRGDAVISGDAAIGNDAAIRDDVVIREDAAENVDSLANTSSMDSADAAQDAPSSFNNYGRVSHSEEARYVDPNKTYYKPWLSSYPEDVPEFVDTHVYENLDELFMTAVEAHGDHVAYSNFGSELTFNEVGDLAQAFAAFLQVKLGMRRGDKLAIMMPNLMQYPIVFFGAIKAGLTVININPLYTPRELQLMLENSDASAIVVLANVAHNLQSIIDRTKLKHVIVASVGDCLGLFKGLVADTIVHFKGMVPHFEFKNTITLRSALRRGLRCVGAFNVPEMHYEDIVLLQYTGGTTGRSKGAMLSHGNLIANVAQALGMYGSQLHGTQERILTVIPFYHIFALTVNLILMFEIGAKNILITDPRDIKTFVNTLRNNPDISALTGVNTLFNLFVTHPEFKDIEWKNLNLVIGGGAAVQSGVEQRFFQRTGVHILEGYGLTECSPLCAVCPYTTDHYTGSIGLIVPGTVARIVDVNGEEIQDLERTGELEIKGPQVMHGYYKCDPKQNELVFDDGYLRTGDIARWMEGGYIKLIDRLKDMILVSGFNVFPSEIEDVVSRFNRVLECAVIGVPSEKTGEAVKLFVVKKDPALTEAEIKNYCRAYLTPYKVPSVIEFVDSLPKSGLGKVLRRKLRENNISATTVQTTAMSVQAQASTSVMSHGDSSTTMGMAAYSMSTHDAAHATAHASAIVSDTESAAVQRSKVGALDEDAVLELASHSTASQLYKPKTEQERAGHEAIEQNVEQNAAAQNLEKPEKTEKPAKKTSGALALERLLSSTSDGFDAATATPNIHKQEHASTKKWQRSMASEDDDE